MGRQLWGLAPHSHAVVFDKVTMMDKLQHSKMAIKLIETKPQIKTPKEVIEWVKQAMNLLGKAASLSAQDNESVQYLLNVSKGLLDTSQIGTLLLDMEGHIEALNDEKLVSGKVAEIAHAAISHWAKLEVETNV